MVGFIEQEVDGDSMSANVGVCFNVVGDPTAPFAVTDEAFGTKLQDWDQFYLFDADNWDLTCYTFKGAGKGWDVTYADTEKAPDSFESISIAPGSSLYYYGANEAFKTVGEVAPSGKQTITFDPDESYAFDFANPFPVATTFGDLETFVTAWDQFYVFDPLNWDLNCYTFKGAGKGWDVTYADSEKDPETINDPSAIFLAPGQGATYIPMAKTTWEVTVNY